MGLDLLNDSSAGKQKLLRNLEQTRLRLIFDHNWENRKNYSPPLLRQLVPTPEIFERAANIQRLLDYGHRRVMTDG